MSSAAIPTIVDGRELELTSLDRLVYPAAGWTKRDVLAYYAKVAPFLLPHLRGRAVEVRVHPDGASAPGFWQRDLPRRRPEWVQEARVYAETRRGEIAYPHLVDRASLLWAVNQNMLEFHVFLARFASPREPTSMVFDLDPGEGRDALDCAEVALVLRDALATQGLRSFPKTSGGKGLQLFVPLNAQGLTFARTKAVARAVAERFAKEAPGLVTSRVAKSARKGRVLIDWGQNERNHLMVAPYSLRARERPMASGPLRWREVEEAVRDRALDRLRLEADEVLARAKRWGDLFREVLTLRQALPG